MNNAKKKEVFQAYKYTKSRSVKKLSSISHNDEIKIQFEEKCDALIEAIFPPPLDSIQEESPEYPMSQGPLSGVTNNFQNRQHRRKWEKVIHREIKIAMFSSLFKIVSGSDEISFLILQKSYHAILDLFDMVFSEFIKNEYHSQC